MKKFFGIFKNKWVKFAIVAIIYILFVIWLRSPLWFLGLIVIFDIYISKKVHWAFWKKRYKEGEKRSSALDWLDAIIFAVVATTLIRIFLIEAYTIPTASMEKSLMIGDYLFVSKVSYGPKIPNTPLSMPLVHNTMPFTQMTKSYLEWIKWDYKRLSGFGNVKRNDVVVFNFPNGDTIISGHPEIIDYYQFERHVGVAEAHKYPCIVRPVDKKDNYVKRCIAIAGDSLRIVNGIAYINGERQNDVENMQYVYRIKTNGMPITTATLDALNIDPDDRRTLPDVPLTAANVERLKKMQNVVSVEKTISQSTDDIFPYDKNLGWTEDNFGPIWIPKKGATVELTVDNMPFYRRIISVYEANELREENGEIYINGEKTNKYTFKMDYYWMMGDNRHRSYDSRYWGFVPEDHIVGKASFIWFSSDKNKSFPSNIRWSRMFRFIK